MYIITINIIIIAIIIVIGFVIIIIIIMSQIVYILYRTSELSFHIDAV